jgi:hypothetical protein
MIVTDIKNQIYANAENTQINCIVKFDEILEYVPFTASSNDPMDYGRELYAQLVAGQWGQIAPYISPAAPIMDPAKQVGPKVL